MKIVEFDTMYGKASFVVDRINIVYQLDPDSITLSEMDAGVKSAIGMEGGQGPVRLLNSYRDVIERINQA